MTRSLFVAAIFSFLGAGVLVAQTGPTAQELPEELKRIRNLYLRMEDEEALNAANEYLVTHPGDPVALEFRARCLRQLGRFEDAAKTAAAILPPSPRIKLLQAICLGMSKETAAQAQEMVDEVAADDPNAVEAHLARARIYLAQGKLKEAGAEISYVRTTKPKLFEGQLLAGVLAETGGVFDEALMLYLPLVTNAKEFEQTDVHHTIDAVMGVAGCYMKLQRYEEAATLYQQLCERFPKAPGAHGQLAGALAMLERNAEAMAALEKALEIVPGAVEFRLRLAELYRGAGRNDDAIAEYRKVSDSGVTGPVALMTDLRLAQLYLERGELEKAKAHGLAALAAAPEHEEALAVNATVREKLGDLAGAKEAYRKALARNPTMFDSLYRLGLLLARSEDPAEQEEAKKLLERHKRVEPFIRDIRRTQRELEVNPRSPLMLTRLAGFLNLAGEYEIAKQWALASERLSPGSLSTLIQLAYISANLGDNTSALAYFEKAQQLLVMQKAKPLPELDEYVEKLKKGESLPLPMGQLQRPAQQPGDAPPSGQAPSAGAKSGG